jgi:hypothetical protein
MLVHDCCIISVRFAKPEFGYLLFLNADSRKYQLNKIPLIYLMVQHWYNVLSISNNKIGFQSSALDSLNDMPDGA